MSNGWHVWYNWCVQPNQKQFYFDVDEAKTNPQMVQKVIPKYMGISAFADSSKHIHIW